MREFGWRGCIAAVCVGLMVGCGEKSASAETRLEPAERTPAAASTIPEQDAAAFVGSLRLSQAVEGELVLDHAVPVRGMVPATVIVLASSSHRRFVAVFEADPGVLAASAQGPVGYRRVLRTSLPRLEPNWNHPAAPQQADLGGGVDQEVLLGFTTVLADRVAGSALILARGEDGWMALQSPDLIGTLRDQLGKTRKRPSLYQEDKMNSIEVSGKRISLLALSMGGGWHISPAKDGRPARLLGLGVLTDHGSGGRRHQAAIAAYRWTGEGWETDADYHEGHVRIFDDIEQARAEFR